MENSQNPEMSSETSASPSQSPNRVDPSEMAELFGIISKLSLVHELSLDRNFEIGALEMPDNSLYKVVKDSLHNAFWDIFRKEICQDPPVLNQAFSLLEEIKQNLFDIMLPHNVKLREEVEEAFDFSLLRQQAEHNALDVSKFAKYILSIMQKVCAPIRDEEIEKLRNTTDTTELFRGILELLHLMKKDLLNYTLNSIKPEIQSNGYMYERKAFANLLKWKGSDDLPLTKAWLQEFKHLYDPSRVNESMKDVLCQAFSKLFDYSLTNENCPETLTLDINRVHSLQGEFYRLLLSYTTLLSVLNGCHSSILLSNKFQLDMRKNIYVLTERAFDDSTFKAVIPNLKQQIFSDANSAREEAGLDKLTEAEMNTIEDLLLSSAAPEHQLRQILKNRLLDYLYKALRSGNVTEFPSALVLYKPELIKFASNVKELVYHNISVFIDYYNKILVAET